MRKRLFMVLALTAVVVVFASNAYAAEGTSAWDGFWTSTGSFFYNILPWNWGEWMGK